MMDWMRAPIGIAGAGRIAQTLGRILSGAGAPVAAIASRSPEHARRAAEFIGAGVEATGYTELAARAGRILIAVPDDALEHVASLLQPSGGLLLHTCGSKGPLRIPGVHSGVLHPLQTIPEPAGGAAALRGASFAVSGDEPAVAWAEEIVRLAGGHLLRIADDKRPLYHAAAVMASNYVTALLAAAQSLMELAGVEAGAALRALAPLARASVENAVRLGPAQALTGPIQRGDLATVCFHVAALESAGEPVRALYRAAGREALALAQQRGLAAETAAALEEILQ